MMERRFFVSGPVSKRAAGDGVVAHADADTVTQQQRAQADVVFGSSLSNRDKMVAINAILAGATLDLRSLAAQQQHAPMPALTIERSDLAVQRASTPGETGQPRMPGIAVGRAVVAHADARLTTTPRREGPNGHWHMPGITIGRAQT